MPLSKSIVKKLSTTRWFASSSRPVREGVYERQQPGARFACWNGRAWNVEASSSAGAAAQTRASDRQDVPWRGLVTPSDAPCATCRGHTVIDRGFDDERGIDLIAECPDC
jgi:hypothetical protein